MNLRRCLTTGFLCLFLSFNAWAANAPLRALVLSGKNNHDWQSTTPALKRVLEESGMFTVRVLDDPSQCDEQLLKNCDVIVSNWTNFPATERAWGARAEEAIMKFVRSGKGFALVHAASACFPSWPEYQQLIGATWGEKTGHGPYHAFNVSVTDTAHPVTRVIGDFTTEDELWHRMDRRPEAQVLCDAYSDTTGGGTGRHEPVAYTTEFGYGRGFYLVLGHDTRAMLHPAWKMLLLRGTEWAATGRATIEAPFDIPRMLQRMVGSADTSKGDLMAGVQQLVQSSSRNRSLRRALAKGMAGLLGTDMPVAWKKFFCEQLSVIGTAEEVPALARLLADSSLWFPSRFALERIPGNPPLDAMREKAATSTGRPLIGLVNAMGERKNPHAIDHLQQRLAAADNAALQKAAIRALGKIGGPESVRLLENCPTNGSRDMNLVRAEGLLRCAEAYESAGALFDAAAIYALLNVPDQAPHVRTAGFAGQIRCRHDRAAAMVRDAMRSGDEILQAGVVRALREAGGTEVAGVVVENIARVPSTLRGTMLFALADLGEVAALPEMYNALAARDRTARAAAFYGIGRLGDSSSVNRLCGLIGKADPWERGEIRKSLARLHGKGVNEQLFAQLKGTAVSAVKQELIPVVAARGQQEGVPVLLQVAKNGKAEEKKLAIKALGSLADPAMSPELVRMLAADAYAGQRASLVKALVTLGTRDRTPDAVCDAVLAGLPGCRPGARESMFRVLSEFGGAKGFQAVRSALAGPDPAAQTAAIRALSAWPDCSPLDDLLTLAHAPGSTGTRLLAMRGAFALLEKSNGLSDNERLSIIDRELQRAESGEGKRLLISILGKQTSVQALQVAVSCLSQPDIADEAALAVVGIAQATGKNHPQDTHAALKKALESTHSSSVAEQVRPLLVGLESQTDKRKTDND